MKPWFETFFDDWYRHEYGHLVDEAKTRQQVEFIARRLALEPGQRLLDLCCGQGRHALLLARMGVEVIGQDLHSPAVEAAQAAASAEGLPARFFSRDMRDIPYEDEFDAVINMFTAFAYFEDSEEDAAVLRAVCKALKPGGRFFLDFINQPGLMRQYDPRDFQVSGDGTLTLLERRYDPLTGFNSGRTVRVAPDGTRTESVHRIRVYTPHQLAVMLQAAGLSVEELHGDFDGGPWTMDGMRVLVVARKTASPVDAPTGPRMDPVTDPR